MSDEADTQQYSAQGYLPDPRNEQVLVYVNGDLIPRGQASISVFDSGFVLGDGVGKAFASSKARLSSSTRIWIAYSKEQDQSR